MKPKVALINELLKQKSPTSFEQILAYLPDEDAEVRAEAVGCLAMLNLPRAMPILVVAFQNDPDDDVKETAFLDLRELTPEQHGEQAAEIIYTTMCEYLRKSESESNNILRCEIIDYIVHFDRPETIELLIPWLDVWDFRSRSHAAESLLKLNRESLRPVWENLMKANPGFEDPVVEDAVTQALKELDTNLCK